jgi:predicted glycoside hydrolase/deacetylase ChbG (UPF0249 family)
MALLVLLCTTFAARAQAQPAPAAARAGDLEARKPIRLLVRADDMGAAQAMNTGCIEAVREGIARSVEVIVPGPWFLDAVRRIEEAGGVDVGVHLTLTSEWDRAKWRPLTHAPSLVDADGYFHATTAAFLAGEPKLAEVERELRAQIEAARRHLGDRVTHVSAHMGAAAATPRSAR